MVGIRESLDLNIDAALAKVSALGKAIDKAAVTTVRAPTSGAAASAVTAEVGTAATTARKQLEGLARTAVQTVSPALAGMEHEASGVTAALSGGAGVAVAGVAAAGALGLLALKGVKSFTELASQIRTVQRATGATAEDASKLVAIGNVLGVEAGTQAAAFFKLSRAINDHSDVLAKDGITVARNSQGQVDLSATLLNVADAYQAAGKGAAGNAVLFDAFGRSGLALAPILAKSREELQFFIEEAAKHHEFLTDDDLHKAFEFKIATHDMTEALTGLERELGSAIIPLLISFSHAATDVIENIDKIGNAVSKLGAPTGGAGRGLGGLIKDVPGVGTSIDLLRGHFKDAATDIIPLSNTFHNLTTRAKETAPAAKDAATAIGDLGDAADDALTPAEKLRAALDGTLGSYIDTERAALSVRKAVSDLAQAQADGAKKGETASAFQARIKGGALDVVDAVTKQFDAEVALGVVTGSTSDLQRVLAGRLLAVAGVFPGLRAEIAKTIASMAGLNEVVKDPFGNIVSSAEPISAAPDFTKLLNDARTAGNAAAAATTEAIKTSLRRSGRDGFDIGGFILEGVRLDPAQLEKVNLGNFLNSLQQGIGDAVTEAAKIDPREQLEILQAVERADQAEKDLAETRKELGANSIEAAIAERDLATAHEDVNIKILDSLDATKAVNEILAQQKEAADKAAQAEKELADAAKKAADEFDAAVQTTATAIKAATDAETARAQAFRAGVGTIRDQIGAVRSLAAAQRDLGAAQKAVADLAGRQTQLPGLIGAAEARLAQTRADAARSTSEESLAIIRARQQVGDAERTLTQTRRRGRSTADEVSAAELEVLIARDRLTQAQTDAVGATSAVTDAERELADLQKEQVDGQARLAEAVQGVTDAQLSLLDVQQRLVDVGQQLVGNREQVLAYFRGVGEAAGLTGVDIDAFLALLGDQHLTGQNFGASLAAGIRQSTPDVITAAAQAALGADEAVRRALGIASPSKVGKTRGQQFIDGIAAGLRDTRTAEQAAVDAVNSIAAAAAAAQTLSMSAGRPLASPSFSNGALIDPTRSATGLAGTSPSVDTDAMARLFADALRSGAGATIIVQGSDSPTATGREVQLALRTAF